MNIQQRAIIGTLVVVGFIFFTNREKFSSNSLTNDDVNGIIVKVEKAFEDAESKILKPDVPKPDDKPVGPDPDAAKCICKGTGKIVQGDGHVSPCPYHSGDVPDVMDDNYGSDAVKNPLPQLPQQPQQMQIRKGVLNRLFNR